VDRATDRAYLRYQYGTTAKLDTRIEAHQRYSERSDDYLEWVLDRLDPHPGELALDVGCGKGSYHPPLIARGRTRDSGPRRLAGHGRGNTASS
jgi:hypothetical protein